jgi:hypothetical protein
MLVGGFEANEDFGGGFKEDLRLGLGNFGDVLATMDCEGFQHPMDFRHVVEGVAFFVIFRVHRFGFSGGSVASIFGVNREGS